MVCEVRQSHMLNAPESDFAKAQLPERNSATDSRLLLADGVSGQESGQSIAAARFFCRSLW